MKCSLCQLVNSSISSLVHRLVDASNDVRSSHAATWGTRWLASCHHWGHCRRHSRWGTNCRWGTHWRGWCRHVNNLRWWRRRCWDVHWGWRGRSTTTASGCCLTLCWATICCLWWWVWCLGLGNHSGPVKTDWGTWWWWWSRGSWHSRWSHRPHGSRQSHWSR